MSAELMRNAPTPYGDAPPLLQWARTEGAILTAQCARRSVGGVGPRPVLLKATNYK